MRAITTEEFKNLLDWIKENCGFYNMENKGKITKYVECSFDTRDGTIRQIIIPDYDFSIRDTSENNGKTIADGVKEFLLNKDIKE